MGRFLQSKFIVGFLMLLICNISFSQMDFEWATHLPNGQYSGEKITIKATCVDSNDNTFVIGQFKGAADFDPSPGSTILISNGLEDIFIAKFSPFGDLLEAHNIGGYGSDNCAGIELDSIGNIYIAGSIIGEVDFDLGNGIYTAQNPGDAGVFVTKYAPNFTHLWTITFGSPGLYEQINDIDVYQNGEVFIAGNYNTSIDLDPDTLSTFILNETGVSYGIFLAKYSANGTFVWGDQMRGTYKDARDIETDHLGNLIVTGDFSDSIAFSDAVNTFYPSLGFTDVFIVKYTNNGNLDWVNVLGGNGFSEGVGLTVDNSNNIIATGSFYNTINLSAGAIPDLHVSFANSEDIFIGKYSPTGTLLVGKRFGGVSNDNGMEVVCDELNNIYLAGAFQGSMTVMGTTITSLGSEDVFFFRMDNLANVTSVKSFGGTYLDAVADLEINSSNQLRIAGSFAGTVDFDLTSGVNSLSTPSFNSPINAYLVAYDFLNSLDWVAQLGATAATSYNDNITDIAVDNQGNSYIAGNFTHSLDLDGNGPMLPIYANGTTANSSMGFLAKLDGNGAALWCVPFLSGNSSLARSVALNADGDILVTGLFVGTVDFDPSVASATKTSAGSDMFVAKYDENGNHLWSKSVGAVSSTVEANSIVSDAYGNVFITGRFVNSSSPVDFDPSNSVYLLNIGTTSRTFLLKLNNNGLFVFAKEYGSGTSYGNCVIVDAANNIYLGGHFAGTINFSSNPSTNLSSYQNSTDGYFAKLDNNGSYILSKSIWGPNIERINSIGLDSEGRISVLGYFAESINFDGIGSQMEMSLGSNDIFLAHYEPNGDFRWAVRLGGSGDDVGVGLTVDSNDNVYASGYNSFTLYPDPSNTSISFPNNGSYNGYVAKYNVFGEYISGNSIYGSGVDQTLCIKVMGDDIYSAGCFSSVVDFDNSGGDAYLNASSSRDIFVTKYSQLCNNYSSSYQVTACESYFDSISGNTYTSSGEYSSNLISLLGCDSSVQLNAFIYPEYTTYLNELSCASYTLPETGVVYTTSGNYTIDLQSSHGCDSTVILDLIIGNSPDQTMIVEECGSYTWDFNNQTYTSSGVYSSTIINQYGCDSTFTLDLTLLQAPNVSTTQTASDVSVPAGAQSYIWLDCDANYAVIFGANQSSFTPSYNGSFAVIVSNQQCTDTSSCVLFNSVNVTEHDLVFDIYPNPTNNAVSIDLPNAQNSIRMKLLDASARIISENEFDGPQQVELFIDGEAGIYFLHIEINGSHFVEKIVKLNP